MPVLGNGVFSFTIPSSDLAKGLRPSKHSPRNTKFLTKCEGAVGIDNVLQVIKDLELERLDTSALADQTFPYPQLFVFTYAIIVCTPTQIYEVVNGTLSLKLTTAEGILWSAVDFFDFVYMSNSAVSVIRRATDQGWEEVTNLPTFGAVCNYNGQVIIGSPGPTQL